MQFSKILSVLLVAFSLTSALPVGFSPNFDSITASVSSIFETRASCAATCGSVCYSSSAISSAVSRGYSDYKSGSAPGGYPHTYNNYEGFNFGVSGPYQEFPILSSGKLYTGGSPGADRVIFNTGGTLAGVITHTGASGNNFVSC